MGYSWYRWTPGGNRGYGLDWASGRYWAARGYGFDWAARGYGFARAYGFDWANRPNRSNWTAGSNGSGGIWIVSNRIR